MRFPSFIPRKGSTLVDAGSWIRAVSDALNRGLDIREHFAGQVVSFRYNSDTPPTVLVDLSAAPCAAMLLSARLTDGSPATLSGGVVTWEWAPTRTSGAVLISSLSALTASTDYDVTLWLAGG